MYQSAGTATQTSPVANSLIRSGSPVTRTVTLLAGSTYAAGSVLGTITASKKAILSLAAASDGSQLPDFVLPYAVDATAGDVSATVYETGNLNGESLVLGTGHTLASIREGLRDKGITISA